MEEKKETSFTVKDKRRFVVDDSGGVKPEGEVKAEAEKAGSEESRAQAPSQTREGEKEVPLPEIDFSTFILSLSSNALLHLGLMENPYTRKIERNLSLAKQTIDIIAMLKEKTRGNLSSEEENLILNLLTDLRLKYVTELNKG